MLIKWASFDWGARACHFILLVNGKKYHFLDSPDIVIFFFIVAKKNVVFIEYMSLEIQPLMSCTWLDFMKILYHFLTYKFWYVILTVYEYANEIFWTVYVDRSIDFITAQALLTVFCQWFIKYFIQVCAECKLGDQYLHLLSWRLQLGERLKNVKKNDEYDVNTHDLIWIHIFLSLIM